MALKMGSNFASFLKLGGKFDSFGLNLMDKGFIKDTTHTNHND